MNVQKKDLVIGFGVFLVLLIGVVVVYLVLNSTKTASPIPKPETTPNPSIEQEVPGIFNVGNDDSCSLSFVVSEEQSPRPRQSPPASSRPSPSPSPSPFTSPSLSPSIFPSPSPSGLASAALDCVVKRIYEDDTRNVSGNYYLQNEILDTGMLKDGQVIVYNIQIANNGGVAVSDPIITDILASNLTFMDADPDCRYNSTNRTVICTLAPLAANSRVARSIRVAVRVTGTQTVANSALVTSTNGQSDSCAITVSATGEILHSSAPAPTSSAVAAASESPTELPEAGVFSVTTNTLGVGLLLLIVGALGLLLL